MFGSVVESFTNFLVVAVGAIVVLLPSYIVVVARVVVVVSFIAVG